MQVTEVRDRHCHHCHKQSLQQHRQGQLLSEKSLYCTISTMTRTTLYLQWHVLHTVHYFKRSYFQ